ncbi:MAG: phosphatase PAP2 family protein [Clostridia bacterium]|nr:phosphatase PAP2 family protein [Clostridia bacterium]
MFKKITKKAWIEIGISLGIFVAIAIVAAFFDLQINKALDNTNSLFGQFFANLGELPTYLAAPILGGILFYQDFGKSSKQKFVINKVCGATITFVGYLAAIFMWFWDNFVSEEVMYSIIYIIFFAVIMSVLTILAFAAVPAEKRSKVFWFAVFLAGVAALGNAIVQVMKFLWARQRYRTMTPGNPQYGEGLHTLYPNYDYDGYTPWYIINSFAKPEIRTEEYMALFDKDHISSPFQSFPSGHTVAAAASFGLIIVPDLFPEVKKHKWVFWTVPMVYTGLVGISRIVNTAHYLSDTLFGFYVGYGVAALGRFILINKVKPYMPEVAECAKIEAPVETEAQTENVDVVAE